MLLPRMGTETATAVRCYRFYQQTGASRGFCLGVARGESESARERETEKEIAGGGEKGRERTKRFARGGG